MEKAPHEPLGEIKFTLNNEANVVVEVEVGTPHADMIAEALADISQAKTDAFYTSPKKQQSEVEGTSDEPTKFEEPVIGDNSEEEKLDPLEVERTFQLGIKAMRATVLELRSRGGTGRKIELSGEALRDVVAWLEAVKAEKTEAEAENPQRQQNAAGILRILEGQINEMEAILNWWTNRDRDFED